MAEDAQGSQSSRRQFWDKEEWGVLVGMLAQLYAIAYNQIDSCRMYKAHMYPFFLLYLYGAYASSFGK